MKTCIDCLIDRDLEDFPLAPKRSDGHSSYCRECMGIRSKASYRKRRAAEGRPVREKEILPKGMRRCRDCLKVQALEAFPRNKCARDGRHSYCKPCHNARTRETVERLHGTTRHYHLMRRHSISALEADEILVEQDDVCPICLEKPAVHVDHDHATGRVRGILCFNCNGGLGQFRDRVDIMLNAIRYLERTKNSPWPPNLV